MKFLYICAGETSMKLELGKGLAIVLFMLAAMCGSAIGDDKYILWDYSGYTTNHVGYFDADSGYTYMVIDIELENHGYSEFDVNPFYFEAVVNKVQYECDTATFDSAINTLPSVTLQDGGAISGQLVYMVPEDATQYSIKYNGWADYNFVRKT